MKKLLTWWKDRQKLYLEAEAAIGFRLPDLMSRDRLLAIIDQEHRLREAVRELMVLRAKLADARRERAN
jgi:hypothetical protein